MLTWKLEDGIVSYWLDGILIAREAEALRTSGMSVPVVRRIRGFAPKYESFKVAMEVWNARKEIQCTSV